MNARSIVTGLIFVNLALAAALVMLLMREPKIPDKRAAQPVTQTNVLTRVAVRKVNSTNYWLLPANFNWSSLESTNYVDYMANLRAIGCPDETIRDILIADIAKLYARRRGELRVPFQSAQFWRAESPWKHQIGLGLRSLNAEQKNLIRQLLGVDLDQELEKYSTEPPSRGLDLAFLASGKQDQVSAIVERYRRLQQEVHETSAGLWTDQDGQQLREIEEREAIELRAVLSPQEFEDYQMRYSSLSDELRGELDGMNPSEEEFKRLFRLRSAAADSPAGVATSEKSGDENRISDEQARQMRATLGEERWNEYQRAQEPGFRALRQLADRFDLNQNTVDEAFSYLETAEQQATLLISDPNLNPARREEALREISTETSAALRGVLGNEAFPYFSNGPGKSFLNFGR